MTKTDILPENPGVIETIESYNYPDKEDVNVVKGNEEKTSHGGDDDDTGDLLVAGNGEALTSAARREATPTAGVDQREDVVSKGDNPGRPVEAVNDRSIDETGRKDVAGGMASEINGTANGVKKASPNHRVVETIIDADGAFPDPPSYDPSSTANVADQSYSFFNDDNNKATKSNRAPSTPPPEPLPITSNDKTNSEANQQTDTTTHSAAPTSGESNHTTAHDFNDSQSSFRIRQSSRFSLTKPSHENERSALNFNKIDDRSSTTSQTVPKPKSSLREPVYKYQREEFLDNDMLISNSKLDGLLYRLFANRGHAHQRSNTKSGGEDTTWDRPLPFLDDADSDLISMDPITWNLRPMTAVQKEALDTELDFLQETLSPKQVVRRLFMDGVLTHMDYNQIMHIEGQGDKAVVRLLVATLKRRGEKAFPKLLTTLKDLDYSRIWERLDSTARSLNDGIADDQRRSQARTRSEVRLRKSSLKTHFENEEDSEEVLRQFLQSGFDHVPSKFSTSQTGLRPRSADSEKMRAVASSRQYSSVQLEQQLNDINAELKALHENLNLLQSARSSYNVRQSRQEADPTGTISQQESAAAVTTTTTGIPSVQQGDPVSRDSDADHTNMETTGKRQAEAGIDDPSQKNRSGDVKAKSGTCSVL